MEKKGKRQLHRNSLVTNKRYFNYRIIFLCLVFTTAVFYLGIKYFGINKNEVAYAATGNSSYTDFRAGETFPVLKAGNSGSWDEVLREKVWVMQENGLYKMWYTGYVASSTSVTKIGYATSTDGIKWTKYPTPVINRTSRDQDMSVVKADDGTYYMYVEVNDDHIDLFTSSNGINWVAYAGNPVKTNAGSPVAWKEGSSWYLLYETSIAAPVLDIRLATSTDGKIWLDSPSNPVLIENSDTSPDSIIKEGPTYHLYYHRKEIGGSGAFPAWHATSSDLLTWNDRQKLFPNHTSPYVFRAADGQLRMYLWYLKGDSNYYLRYGLEGISQSSSVIAPLWKLDETSGVVASDSSFSAANGALFNNPTWTTGKINSGLNFDGINDYVETGYVVNLPKWTIATWVKSPAAPSSAPASGPINRDKNFQISWNHPNPTFRSAAAVRVGGTWYAASFGPLQGNTWYHLAATYDGENLKAYKDGVLITTNSSPSGNPFNETASLKFGRHANGPQYFNGTVDQIRIYSRALSDSEVAGLAQIDATPPSGVSNLSAAVSGQIVTLSWNAASDTESGIATYRIHRGTATGTPKTLIAEVSANDLNYTDNNTILDTTYYYDVSATNGMGTEGVQSEIAVVAGNSPPQAPAGFVAVPSDQQTILDWDDNQEADLAGYHVYRSPSSGGPYAQITASLLLSSSSTFTDSGLTDGTTYYYVVKTVDNGDNQSVYSREVAAIPNPSGSSLVGFWKFEEASSTIAYDSSLTGVNGTLINGPSWTTGKVGGGLSFDGVDDYVNTDYVTDLPTWTIATWVKSPIAPSSSAASGPVHRNANFQINWNHPNATFRGAAAFRIGGITTGTWYPASFGSLQANTWYHLAATYDGENFKAYKDGVLITTNSTPSGNADSETNTLKFGRHSNGAQYFSGTADEIRVYNRALTNSEVATLPTSN